MRKSIGKKTRFEVFKRDGFKCQYCGAMAPDALLELDHIHPVSLDGEESMLNYVTACRPCNAGKGNRTLDDDSAIKKQQAQLQDLQARREQIEMMLQWREGLKSIESDQVKLISGAWSKAVAGWHLNDKGLKEARLLLKKHGLQRVLAAIDEAAGQYLICDDDGSINGESVDKAWTKVHAICVLMALPEDERRLYYVRGILRRRLDYVAYYAMDVMLKALRAGVPVEMIEQEAKTCRSWGSFDRWLSSMR